MSKKSLTTPKVLQFRQLFNKMNNKTTWNLRGHIEELEDRVMRRTEQIGIHQHNIKHLEQAFVGDPKFKQLEKLNSVQIFIPSANR
jgi:hypothetical protein